MFRKSHSCAIAAAAVLAMSAIPARADAMKIKADLTAGAEIPANDSKASGELTGTYDPATKKLTWDVTYSGLTGEATMAHFHAPAPMGKSAGVEIPIKGSVQSPIKGEATLTSDEAENLRSGLTYFNVHTKQYPKGEIRGQVLVTEK